MNRQAFRSVLLVSQRELRQGKKTFVLAIITVLLATAMLSSVLGLSDSIRSTLTSDATKILGGNFEIRLTNRNFTDDELSWLRQNSDRTSKLTNVRSAAFTDDISTLMIIRAVDNQYPLFGEITMQEGSIFSYDQFDYSGSGVVAVVVTDDLGGALNIGLGDEFSVGSATVKIVAIATAIPDPSPTMLLNAPIVFMSAAGLKATGLSEFGTLKTERIKIDTGTRDQTVWREDLKATFVDNDWHVRDTSRVIPNLQDIIDRMETMMLLVSLSTLLIAGICIGNTVSTYMRVRAKSIAVLKTLGMSASQIRASYLFVTFQFVLVGCFFGVIIGYYCQTLIINLISSRLPFEISSNFTVLNIFIVPTIAILAAWIFAIRPLHRFCSISPVSLFSLSSGVYEQSDLNLKKAWQATLVPGIALATLLFLVAGDKEFLMYFGIGAILIALFFNFLTYGMIELVKRAKPTNFSAKIAFRTVVRSRDQISASASSLGVGLTALLIFSLTEANFNNVLNESIANKIPEYYLAGLQPGDEEKIRAQADEWLPNESSLLTLPTTRAKITHFNQTPIEELDIPEEYDWIIHGDRYVTWAKDQGSQWTGTSKVSSGEMWTSDNDQLLVSFDEKAAEAFGLGIGDTVKVKLQRQDYDLKIANLRKIDWSSFDVNFVLVMSDGPWSSLPHGYLGSVRELVGDHHQFQRAVVKAAPSVTPIRTKEIIASINGLLAKIGILLQAITLTATISGMMVLAAAIAQGRQRREYESIVLRILGTSQNLLAGIFRIEFLVIASLAAIPSLFVASTAGYLITTSLLNLQWSVDWLVALSVLFSTLLTVLVIGKVSTHRLITKPPLQLIYNE